MASNLVLSEWAGRGEQNKPGARPGIPCLLPRKSRFAISSFLAISVLPQCMPERSFRAKSSIYHFPLPPYSRLLATVILYTPPHSSTYSFFPSLFNSTSLSLASLSLPLGAQTGRFRPVSSSPPRARPGAPADRARGRGPERPRRPWRTSPCTGPRCSPRRPLLPPPPLADRLPNLSCSRRP